MPVLIAGVSIATVAVRFAVGRLDGGWRRRIVVAAAVLAAVLAWMMLAYLVWGPSYRASEVTIDSSGQGSERSFTRSLLEIGISPLTTVVLLGEAISFAILAIGGMAHFAGRGAGRWLMLAGLVLPMGVGLVSFGLANLIPVVVLAYAATLLAFVGIDERAPGRRRGWL